MQKNIYAISPEQDYLKTLATFIFDKADGDFIKLSQAKVILPNRRSALKLKEYFVEISPDKAVILPEIFSLGDLNEDEIEISHTLNEFGYTEIMPAISSDKRLFLLARLIKEKSNGNFNLSDISFEAALQLAGSLATLIDDIEKHELSIENLENIIPAELAQHRQISLDFIRFIYAEYPRILEELGLTDFASRTNQLINSYSQFLLQNQNMQIFIAGSTGSIPATRKLIKTISAMPNGYVFLPYTDLNLNSFEWEEIENEGNKINHQKHIHTLLKFLEVDRGKINLLSSQTLQRAGVISNLMKCASEIRSWKNLKYDNDNLKFINLIQAKNPSNESKLISSIIRQKLQENKSVALITNNQNLAEMVQIYLKKFDINIDSSSGTTLDKTPEGKFLLQVTNLISRHFRISDLLSLLKNNFVKLPELENFETKFIRKNNIKTLAEVFEKFPDNKIEDNLKATLQKIYKLSKAMQSMASLDTLISTTYKIANILMNKIDFESNENWQKIEKLINSFSSFDNLQEIETNLFSDCLRVILSGKKVWPKYKLNKTLAILSPIEARLQHFDCVILGDLTLGSWPAGKFSPWLSKRMLKDMELPFEEDAMALSAHDFASHLHSSEVFITKSEYQNGEPTIESPFISRLKTFYKAVTGADIQPCKIYHNYVSELDGNFTQRKISTLPKPTPPAEARINRLSVTKIETLIKNPYAIYASEILKLRKLDDIDKELEAKEYGTFVHKILENFTASHNLDKNKITKENLIHILNETHQEFDTRNLSNLAWVTQIEQISNWFVELEKEDARNTKQIFWETSIKQDFSINSHNFTLTCKADRIEISKDNKINIADYKTGRFPSQSNVARLISPQLLLEAMMIKNNAFADINFSNNNYKFGKIIYYNFSFAGKGPEKKIYADIELEKITDDVERELKNLIEDLQNPDVPFLVRPNQKLQPDFDDYEHLERIE